MRGPLGGSLYTGFAIKNKCRNFWNSFTPYPSGPAPSPPSAEDSYKGSGCSPSSPTKTWISCRSMKVYFPTSLLTCSQRLPLLMQKKYTLLGCLDNYQRLLFRTHPHCRVDLVYHALSNWMISLPKSTHAQRFRSLLAPLAPTKIRCMPPGTWKAPFLTHLYQALTQPLNSLSDSQHFYHSLQKEYLCLGWTLLQVITSASCPDQDQSHVARFMEGAFWIH
jgi:hypothetical protein